MKNESFSNKNKIQSINKKNPKKKILYGMTLEQYREGLEIHSKCFAPVEKMTLKLINKQPLI